MSKKLSWQMERILNKGSHRSLQDMAEDKDRERTAIPAPTEPEPKTESSTALSGADLKRYLDEKGEIE